MSIWIQNLIWIQMCNYSSLSFLLDKIFDIVIKGEEEWGMQEEDFWRKILGCEKSCAWEGSLYPAKRKRKKRKKSGCKVFGEFPRVLAWDSGSEKVRYECREPTKSQKDLQHPLKHICWWSRASKESTDIDRRSSISIDRQKGSTTS